MLKGEKIAFTYGLTKLKDKAKGRETIRNNKIVRLTIDECKVIGLENHGYNKDCDLAAAAQEIISIAGNVNDVPNTGTAYVRRAINQLDYRGVPTLSRNAYRFAKKVFRGGEVLCNRWYKDTMLHDIRCYDRCSSYPDVIYHERYPIGGERPLISLKSNNLWIAKVAFKGLKVKRSNEPFPYIDIMRCDSLKKIKQIDGRVLKADYIECYITNVDMEIIESVYDWDTVILLDGFEWTECGRIYVELREFIKNAFKNKTVFKDDIENKSDYLRSKIYLNTIAGLLQQHQFNYDCNKHYSFIWGVFLTAYGRKELRRPMLNDPLIANDIVYGDTDSLKGFDTPEFNELIKMENNRLIKRSKHNGCFATNVKGDTFYMGMWDDEGLADMMIVKGPKAYATYNNGKVDVVWSGVNKKDANKELNRIGFFALLDVNFSWKRVRQMDITSDYVRDLSFVYGDTLKERIRDYDGKEF